MARYDREFLVPYLQDICAIYMALRKIDQIIQVKQTELRKYSSTYFIQPPDEPDYLEKSSINCLGIFSVCLMVMGGLGLFILIFDSDGIGKMPIWLAVGLLIFALILGGRLFSLDWTSRKDIKVSNAFLYEEYQKAQEKYKHECEQAQKERAFDKVFIDRIQSEIKELYNARNDATHVLNILYYANIIPAQYRNMHAVFYLYRWFNSSGSDDMDHAINMIALEEIKTKLDVIIEQQKDIILNQRIMLVNQRRAVEMQELHHRKLMDKLNSIRVTEEERLKYDKMIEGNTAANAFFAAANYLK